MNERFYGKINLNEESSRNLTFLPDQGLNLELCVTDSTFLFEKFLPLRKELQNTIEQLGLRTILHLPFYGLQLGCKDYYIRDLSYNLISQGLLRCSELNINRAVMHVSFPSHIPTAGAKNWLKSFYLNLEKILLYCQEKKITLYLENTFEPDSEIFERIFDHFVSDNLLMCLDIAHVYCYSKSGFSDWWNNLQSKIGHVHLSDNNTFEDSHLALGKGKIDFQDVFEKSFSKDVTYTLETEISCFQESLAYLARFLQPPAKLIRTQS